MHSAKMLENTYHPDPLKDSHRSSANVVETNNSESIGPAKPPSEMENLEATCLSGSYSSETFLASSENSLSEHTVHMAGPEDTSRPSSPRLGEHQQTFIQRRLSLKESLGRTGSVAIFGGSVIILLSVGFLSLLWFGYGDKPEAAGSPWIWRRIAVNDWMTRTITILALVIRSVVSFQVALCTSMIAALVLEKRSARKSDVAYLSIARSVSDGPRKVVQLLLSSRSWSVLTYVEVWLICLLALVMLALQFSSTLLLSDLHDFIIAGDVKLKPVKNFSTFQILNESGVHGPLLVNDPTYAVFGEERSNSNITPSASGFSDTGIIRRGYLPFQGSENRTSVRKYHGSTLVTNSRIVCVPAQIDGHFLPHDGQLEYLGVGHMTGTLNYSQSLREAYKGPGPLCAGRDCESVPFDCSIPGIFYSSLPQSNLCFIETVGRTSRAIAALWTSDLLAFLNTEGEPWSLNSTIFLISRSSVTNHDWDGITEPYPIPPARKNGEWNKFEVVGGRWVDTSLCFSRFHIEPQYVDMIAEKPTYEPVVEWDGITLPHDTTAASAFVGLESPLKPPRDRGLMDMDILPTPDPGIPGNKTVDGLTFSELSAVVIRSILFGLTTNNFVPGSISGCIFCNDYSFATSQGFCLLFTDIIESTGRAAPALHSYLALSATSAYDTFLKGFNITETVELATTTSVRTPGPCSEYRCSGFISVTTLLGVHLVIVMAITALFVAQARYSRCSNTWHAVAQLVASEELQDVLVQSNNAKDTLITKALQRDKSDYFVKLGQASGSNRVRFLKQDDNEEKVSGRQ
ncbi:hypothetical protein F5Y12DRAFT_794299 [Xylaria sp. FL1777]|nr:hypothetical protein F5Y12DRAFT_794299 [Xylaria sp. FL1777]